MINNNRRQRLIAPVCFWRWVGGGGGVRIGGGGGGGRELGVVGAWVGTKSQCRWP